MKKKAFAAAFSALLLCSCGSGGESAPTSAGSLASAEASESSIVTETAASPTLTAAEETTISVSVSEEISSEGSALETQSETESQTESQTEPEAQNELPVSEIITETEYSELLSSETVTDLSRENVTSADTAVITTLSSAAENVPVVVPKVKKGNFSGEKMLENELAAVDITSASEGVIKINYKGSCGKVKVRITKGEALYDYSLDSGGSVFPLQSGKGTYNVKVLENVTGKTYAIVLDMNFEADITDELSPFLLPSQYISFDTPDKCVYKAAELCAGKSGVIEKASAMFLYVTENISYDKELAASVKSGYIPDPDRTLEKGKGICFDYASLYASMCRSQGIPAKLVMGYVRGDVYHAWNEIYTSETGWITVDLFLDSKGWNLLDPTFYASASDKAGVSEYIGMGSDYSAVYYY